MRTNSFTVILMISLLSLSSTRAQAGMITGASKGGPPVSSPDGKYVVSLTNTPVTALAAPTKDDLALLKSTYTNWTFNTGAASPGTFNVLQYTPFALKTLGGADFSVLYNDGTGKPQTTYDWVQVAHPHNWGTFGSKANVDSSFSNIPFYSNYTPQKLPTLQTPTSFYNPDAIWLDSKNYPQQNIQNPAGGGMLGKGGTLIFNDEPYLSYSAVPALPDNSSDQFDLYLVTFTYNGKGGKDAGGTVTILDGMQWGVQISMVPEPSTVGMLAFGFLAVLGYSRRHRRVAQARKRLH